jgi:superfamily II DNA or RNA helicase
MLSDFTVTHNTHWILELAKSGKRIMLVLPYISVITNKVENDHTITSLFDTFYGQTDIKEIAYGRNAVTTFDKFSRSNYDKISKMFDYIIIDESHLLFTSSYRIEATSNVIKKIKELFYISSNDPFSAKLLLMTGTETGESHFFQ